MTQTLAKAVRSFPAPKGYRGRIIVTAELHNCGNAKAHFSVTAAIGTDHQLQTGEWQAGGCLHDECLSAWPEIAPLIALHLSDEDGQPMHHEANGWYWMAKAIGIQQKYEPEQKETECYRIAAEHLRISMDDAYKLGESLYAEYLKGYATQCQSLEASERAKQDAVKEGARVARARFAAFVESQRERWQAEANAGLALIRSFSNSETVAA